MSILDPNIITQADIEASRISETIDKAADEVVQSIERMKRGFYRDNFYFFFEVHFTLMIATNKFPSQHPLTCTSIESFENIRRRIYLLWEAMQDDHPSLGQLTLQSIMVRWAH